MTGKETAFTKVWGERARVIVFVVCTASCLDLCCMKVIEGSSCFLVTEWPPLIMWSIKLCLKKEFHGLALSIIPTPKKRELVIIQNQKMKVINPPNSDHSVLLFHVKCGCNKWWRGMEKRYLWSVILMLTESSWKYFCEWNLFWDIANSHGVENTMRTIISPDILLSVGFCHQRGQSYRARDGEWVSRYCVNLA